MKRILAIFAGGTIASGFQGKTKIAGPDANNFKSLHKTVKEFFIDKAIDEIICCEPLGIPGKDSSNIHPGHWLKITALIANELQKGLDGVLILYGTDTMAYLSAWLKICFPKISIPVILTGSQLTLDYLPGDVMVNLRGAAQVVCSNFIGIWIYCNWKLIPGDRAHKSHALHPDIFTALNSMPVYFNPEWALKDDNLLKVSKEYKYSSNIDKILNYEEGKARDIYEKIGWIMCAPGIKPTLSGQERILCIYGFGAGNAPTEVLDYLRVFYTDKKKPEIIACSQAEGDMKKPNHYDKVGIALLVKDGFKVWSQMDYPIEFIHSLACFALLSSFNSPGKILSKYLTEKF